MLDSPARPLFDAFPILRGRLPWCALGEFPTPIHDLSPVTAALGASSPAFVKRDDLSSPVYGGNKVRTLEVLFGHALFEGASHIYSTGAFGTNHGVATALHAPRVGLRPGLVTFPQPASHTAVENFRVLKQSSRDALELMHWSQLPAGMAYVHTKHRARGERPYVMVPGGATPRGALGYVSAALELAHQVAAGEMPAPRSLIVGVGSTCTSAGLLVGTRLAARLGIGWKRPPHIISVRVTPWPVTSPLRIVNLAYQAAELLHELTGDRRVPLDKGTLTAGVTVDGAQLGRGYGHPTDAGREAVHLFRRITEGRTLELDTTYSAKAAAAVVARLRRGEPGPLLFWSTKSTAPLPDALFETRRPLLRWWMARSEAR